MRSHRTVSIAAAVTLCCAALAGCSSSSTPRDALLEVPVASSATVDARVLPGLGRVLVDGRGYALYMFPPDAGSRVSCTGTCAGTWPPLAVKQGGALHAGPGINAADLSTLADPNTGARIVTYFGYPLYRYADDVDPGEATGQALFNNGGPWYVVSTAGQPVTVVPAATR